MPTRSDLDDDFDAILREFDGDLDTLGASIDAILEETNWDKRHVMSWKSEAAVTNARMAATYADHLPCVLRIKAFSDAVRAGIVF